MNTWSLFSNQKVTPPIPVDGIPQFRSTRSLESLKHEITATSLPQYWNDVLHTSSRCRTVAVIKHVTDIEIFSKESILVSLRNPPKKGLYTLVFDYLFP